MLMRAFVVLLLLASAPAALAEKFDGYKVESTDALTDAKVSDVIRQAVASKGLRLLDDQGKPYCEIWFAKSISATTADVQGANYGQIAEGAFVGVIKFASGVIDFRGQALKAGFYTLRYGLILQDGNHLGVSDARDFLLASPIAEDKDPAATLKTDDLYKISRLASGTGHPSVWSMVPVDSPEGLPKVIKNEREHVILETKIPTKSGELAIGLIVVGKTEG
ncbi:MAG: hypothetical protein J2P41_00365 [Blastocatellia bacterium]|nr:hypothetical protein [Blastocatellia bacterium]